MLLLQIQHTYKQTNEYQFCDRLNYYPEGQRSESEDCRVSAQGFIADFLLWGYIVSINTNVISSRANNNRERTLLYDTEQRLLN